MLFSVIQAHEPNTYTVFSFSEIIVCLYILYVYKHVLNNIFIYILIIYVYILIMYIIYVCFKNVCNNMQTHVTIYMFEYMKIALHILS